MKKTAFLALILFSCSSKNEYPHGYIDDERNEIVIENSDVYITEIYWYSQLNYCDINVCLMPQNEEITLYATTR
jgi:hypothetical protein